VSLVENVAERACAYGMRAEIADGMDVFAVYAAASEALQRARRGEGPTLLELKTFRLCGHSRRDPNNYMSKDEKKLWQSRDPLPSCEGLLIEAGWLDTQGAATMREQAAIRAQAAIAAAQAAPEPEAEDLYQGLYVSMEVPR
jgi:TPP-dependent pyruvate/acetoin dehydrogenase alpha subunit